jgi:hypothetical protein
MSTFQQSSTSEDSTPNTSADGKVENVLNALTIAKVEFTQQGKVGIIPQVNWNSKVLLDKCNHRQMIPPGNVGCRNNQPGHRINESRRRDANGNFAGVTGLETLNESHHAIQWLFPAAHSGNTFLLDG